MTVPGSSWGRYPRPTQQCITPLHWRDGDLPKAEGTLLAYGNGRSYGDSCLNDGGTLLHTRGLDRFIQFDVQTGMLRCEAGVLFSEILDFGVPRGWFLPVTPGTRFVTVGGAVANDVHGKNHHRAGTFGDHVSCFELLRSDGARMQCSRTENEGLFNATIAGLGLTGLITWVQFALKRIEGPWVTTETLRFANLQEFLSLSAQSESSHEYSVAWIDCAASRPACGRGLFIRANHAPAMSTRVRRSRRMNLPFTPPVSLINRASLRMLNALYFRWPRAQFKREHYEPYFYPLDAISNWNRMYGPNGFLQYQCVVPMGDALSTLTELLQRISSQGGGSFLAVLKVFSDWAPAGILSFARAGVTLALDFPNNGAATLDLLERLDDVVMAAGGAVYPAKDARLKGERFRQYFPNWEKMLDYLDPRFSSGFWRRVME